MNDILTLEILTYPYRIIGNLTELLRGDGVSFSGRLAYKYSLDNIISTIGQLAEDGDVIFYRRIRLSKEQRIEKQLCDWQQVEIDLQKVYNNELKHSPMFYELTPQGGAKWEEMFQADWNNFLLRTKVAPKPHGLSLNLSLLQEWVALIAEAKYVDSESICFEKVMPLNLTYWKTVDLGYRVGYRLVKTYLRPGSEVAYAKEDLLARRFWLHYDSLIDDRGNAIG
jgi:hypothetical protein